MPAAARVNYLHQLCQTVKSQPFAQSISLPISTQQAASAFPMAWKLHTFLPPCASLSRTASKREDAFLVTVAPPQLQNTVTHTIGVEELPSDDSSRLCGARRVARAAPRATGSPQFPANPPLPGQARARPGNPKEQVWEEEGTQSSGESERASERERG